MTTVVPLVLALDDRRGRDRLVINANWGLGEPVDGGRGTVRILQPA